VASARLILGALLNDKLSDTVIPFTTAGVNISVELTGSNTLRVQNVGISLVVRTGRIILQRSEGVLQDIIIHSLATTSRSHKHESVTNLASIIKLDNLVLEDRSVHKLEVLQRGLDSVFELTIVHLRLAYSGEKILDNVGEEG
jgi:hypothetical protein